jgi:hypothetical protein
MRSKENKSLATFIVILTSVLLYILGMVTLASNGVHIPVYLTILIAFIPAFLIHVIWKKRPVKNE